jgi:hypothetical protein
MNKRKVIELVKYSEDQQYPGTAHDPAGFLHWFLWTPQNNVLGAVATSFYYQHNKTAPNYNAKENNTRN